MGKEKQKKKPTGEFGITIKEKFLLDVKKNKRTRNERNEGKTPK